MSRSAASRLAVLPQHHTPSGWQLCPDHKAQAWAVIDIRRGKVLSRWQRKARAEDYRKSLIASLQPARSHQLGARCPQRLASAALLATSLNHKPQEYSK